MTGDQENSNKGTASLSLTSEETSKGVEFVTMSNGGSSHTSAPSITFISPDDPSGETAAATVVIESGVVTAMFVKKPGTGYKLVPGITFSGDGGSDAAAAAHPIHNGE